ncbi:hypothetical protein AGROH133_06021 [Agrobacterium tumefaciens]|nr:hypothetical protein AGROH133_06021 [Agrobacterium tumefaciens]
MREMASPFHGKRHANDLSLKRTRIVFVLANAYSDALPFPAGAKS